MPESKFDMKSKTFHFGDQKHQLEGKCNKFFFRHTSDLFLNQVTQTYQIEVTVYLIDQGSYEAFELDCQWSSDMKDVKIQLVGHSKVIHGRDDMQIFYPMVHDGTNYFGMRFG